jgi:hypothetical protein
MVMRNPVWKKRWDQNIKPWPFHSWRALLLVSSAIITFYFPIWAKHRSYHIPVGVYIAIMGLVTAVMALHEGPTRLEKFCWVLCITAFMVAEIRNLYTADQENAHTFGKISDSLDATKRGLEATKNGLDQTAVKIGETATGIQALHNEATGGDSLFYFDVAEITGPFDIDSGSIKKGMMFGNTVPHFVGKYPLSNVSVSTFGPFGYARNELEYGTIRAHQLGKPIAAPYLYFWPDKEQQDFVFFINTSNGSYNQVIIVKKLGGKWLWASRLSKYGRKQPLRTWHAPGFPDNELKNLWGGKP